VLLAQGVPCLPATVAQDRALLRFVGVLAAWRRRHARLLQPPAFDTVRDIKCVNSAIPSCT
jgi:hypothetical protein